MILKFWTKIVLHTILTNTTILLSEVWELPFLTHTDQCIQKINDLTGLSSELLCYIKIVTLHQHLNHQVWFISHEG